MSTDAYETIQVSSPAIPLNVGNSCDTSLSSLPQTSSSPLLASQTFSFNMLANSSLHILEVTMPGSILDSIAPKASTSLWKVGWTSVGKRRYAVVSVIGIKFTMGCVFRVLIVSFSVRIDVDELLRAKEERDLMEAEESSKPSSSSRKLDNKSPRKRKLPSASLLEDGLSKPAKKSKVKAERSVADKPRPTVMLKVSMPKDLQPFPCCLCVSRNEAGLLPVHDIPSSSSGHSNYLAKDVHGSVMWRAHESCAMLVPETWVDEVSSPSDPSSSSAIAKTNMVFGVDTISKDRWNLVSCIKILRQNIRVICVILSEMLCLSEDSSQIPWCPSSVYQGKMPESFPHFLCQRRPGTPHPFLRAP